MTTLTPALLKELDDELCQQDDQAAHLVTRTPPDPAFDGRQE
jgi:hypothetical protein